MSSKTAAVLFPGQGAQSPAMLDGVKNHPSFASLYSVVCDVLRCNPLERMSNGELELINENAISSLLTVLASVISYQEWLNENPAPVAVAGYSIGQWTAFYASGSISYEELIGIASYRAYLMDQCCLETPGAMMAVIGVGETELETYCESIRAKGFDLVISNYNCFGQYSLAGKPDAIEFALSEIASLKPKKAVRIPTSGAWHCHLMEPARKSLFEKLQEINFAPSSIPCIGNVDGKFLSNERDVLLMQLADQVCQPVMWEAGVKTLIEFGANPLVEIGYGKTLTKFDFFIDRSVDHLSYYPSLVPS